MQQKARTNQRISLALDQLATLSLVFPGICLGVAVMEVYLRVPLPIYGSLWIIAIAYVIRYMPYGMRYVYAGVLQLHRELEEAAGATLKPVMASMPLSAGSIDENLRALRYALDQYIGAGDALTSIDFGAIVQKTAAETARLKTALSAHA